ncbi:MAG: hypothetical protein ABFD75_07410 [Smithella sp.]
MDQSTIPNFLQSLAAKWPSAWIARTEVDAFTGGLISEKYLANLDSQGKGPEGRFRSGRKIGYPVNNFLSWLQQRTEIINSSDKENSDE